MKKTLSLIIMALVGSSMAQAQDLITMKDGQDIRAKVLEVSTKELKYKLFEEPEGPAYSVRKTDIAVVRYESGREEYFTTTSISELYYTDRDPVAGLVPGMKYKELKDIYDYQEYSRATFDRYSPVWSGIASYIIPGLGQMVCGEVGRGFAILGSALGGALLAEIVLVAGMNANGISSGAVLASSAIYGGIVGLDIWSIVDAVHVAKVKNMYEQDLRKAYSFDVKLYPSINCVNTGISCQPVAGLTLAMNF